MLKFIIFLITIIAVALCINININEPNVTPNVIETQQNNIVLENNNVLNENNIAENVVNNQEEPSNKNMDKSNSNSISKPENKKEPNGKPSNTTSTPKDTSSTQSKSTFVSKEVPDNIYKKMLGKSIPTEYKDKIDLKTLRYLQISYFGFDGKIHVGEMIVNTKLANDVLEIFKELFEIKYPIEKIKLIDEYNADDNLSMSDNNTSCFCYRVVPGSTKLSNHAKRMCNRYKSFI